MNANNRLQRIADFVYTRLTDTYQKRQDRERLENLLLHSEYRWQHTLRVAQYGKVIAEAESADVELVLATCLLHDVAWFDTGVDDSLEHGRLGAKVGRPLLEDLSFTKDQVDKICYAIASHVDVDNPEGNEARILHDADNVDRFGPYRVLQWCYADLKDYFKLADKLRERITRLENYRDEIVLFTQTGRQLFLEQMHLQIGFFSQFVGEKDISIMPTLEKS